MNININSTIILSPIGLTHDDLLDEYDKLSNLYQILKKENEKSAQEVFELKRHAELSQQREKFLEQELEQLGENQENDYEAERQKHNQETEELRQRLIASKQLNAECETEIEKLRNELVEVEARHASRQTECSCKQTANEISFSKGQAEQIEKFEEDQLRLLHELEELKTKFCESMKCNVKYEAELENLKECLLCTKENLNSKSEELEEKNLIIDTMQEKIVEMNAELEDLKNGSGNKNEKGNSLFAEVDDQRQQMKQILAYQKQQYLKMKQEHQDGQIKIRALQRENANMQHELQQCAKMFKDANATFKKSLTDHIRALTDEVSSLNTKLRTSQSQLAQLAKDKNVTWLGSMLDFCKKETDTLKQQLYLARLQKCESEEQSIRAEEKAAKWRFEALKSRCIIADRELLLEVHKIPFGPAAANSKLNGMTEESINNQNIEDPNISCELPITPLEVLNAAVSTSNNKTDSVILVTEQMSSPIIHNISLNSTVNISDTVDPTIIPDVIEEEKENETKENQNILNISNEREKEPTKPDKITPKSPEIQKINSIRTIPTHDQGKRSRPRFVVKHIILKQEPE